MRSFHHSGHAQRRRSVKPLYLLLLSIEAAAISLVIFEGFFHQTVQIHLVAELQLRVSLQHY